MSCTHDNAHSFAIAIDDERVTYRGRWCPDCGAIKDDPLAGWKSPRSAALLREAREQLRLIDESMKFGTSTTTAEHPTSKGGPDV